MIIFKQIFIILSDISGDDQSCVSTERKYVKETGVYWYYLWSLYLSRQLRVTLRSIKINQSLGDIDLVSTVDRIL